jgi:hypothetical protein
MEQRSIEHVTTIILRLAGVLTIFIGLILATHIILQLIAARSAASGFPQGLPPGMSINLKGAAGRVGGWAIVAQIATIAWGALLAAFAQPIAKNITKA